MAMRTILTSHTMFRKKPTTTTDIVDMAAHDGMYSGMYGSRLS